MKPLLISVDLEFTDGNLRFGQVTQIAFVSETGRRGQWNLPITTKALINEWNWKNLEPLVTEALKLGAQLPNLKWALGQAAGSMLHWLEQDRREEAFRRVEMGELPAEALEDPSKEIPLVMITWCGGYDFAFTDRLFTSLGIPNPFHYEAIDIAGVAYGLGFDWDTSGEDLQKALGMEPNPNPHNALADAQWQLELFRRLQAMRQERSP